MDLFNLTKKAVAWCLLATALIFLLTGFGISYPQIADTMTLGLLGKALSFRIHEVLWAPFLLLLAAHVGFRFLPKGGKPQ